MYYAAWMTSRGATFQPAAGARHMPRYAEGSRGWWKLLDYHRRKGSHTWNAPWRSNRRTPPTYAMAL